MSNLKLVSIPHINHFKLNSKQCPANEKHEKEMNKNSYTVGNLMYVIACTM